MKKILMLAIVVLTAIQLRAQGYYIEMKATVGGNPMASMKVYAQDGNSRSEVSSNMSGVAQINLLMLTLKNAPDMVYMVDAAKKTYSEISAASADYKDAPQEDYEVTVLGKEKVNGYNSVHVRINKKGESNAIEMWTTTELVDYKGFSMIKSKYTGKANLYKQLEAKGAAGFPVRIKTLEANREVVVDLVKAEKRDNSASLFSLDGYTKTDGINNMGIDIQKVMKELQNMTPEEREKVMKMLQQQYSNQPK